MRGEREVRERGGRTPVEEALERAVGRDSDGGLRREGEGEERDGSICKSGSNGASGFISFLCFSLYPAALPFTAVRQPHCRIAHQALMTNRPLPMPSSNSSFLCCISDNLLP